MVPGTLFQWSSRFRPQRTAAGAGASRWATSGHACRQQMYVLVLLQLSWLLVFLRTCPAMENVCISYRSHCQLRIAAASFFVFTCCFATRTPPDLMMLTTCALFITGTASLASMIIVTRCVHAILVQTPFTIGQLLLMKSVSNRIHHANYIAGILSQAIASL